VPRGFLSVATNGPVPSFPDGSSGRLQLAHWIADPGHPLTARVAANRVWHHLFGAGLVRTVDNFGLAGERPSHPELLDHLALRFTESGWSFKTLIREIMLSRTYQLTSSLTQESRLSDPENRLLSHQNRRRLDAEVLHDAILSVSGQLVLVIGGDTVRAGTESEYGYEFDVGRRAVYLPVFRNRLPDLFAVFDFPDPNLSIGRRTVSTLPTQALLMMNSPFVMDQARHVAEQLLAIAEINDHERLDLLYSHALGRVPSEQDRRLVREFVSAVPVPDDDERLARWTGICQAVMGSVEFRYIR
jgi:hypothetical protein